MTEMDEIVEAVDEHVSERLRPQEAEIAALKADNALLHAQVAELRALIKAIPAGPRGEKGERGEDGAAGAPGADGRDGADGAVGPEGPRGEQGERGEQGAPGRDGVDGMQGRAGDQGPRGADGERGPQGEAGPQGNPGNDGERGEKGADADPIDIRDVVAELLATPEVKTICDLAASEAVVKHLQANPIRDGRDGADGRDGKDGAAGAKGDRGEKGDPGADGVGLAGALIDRTGALVVTTTKGDTISLGVVVGANGAAGKDGRPGLDLRNLSTDLLDDGRTVTLTLKDDERTNHMQLSFPVVLDRGVFSEAGYGGAPYARGDAVTFDASLWIAQKDAPAGKPGQSPDWRLAVKKGRPGKDGRDGIDKTAPVKLEPRT